MVVSTSIRTLGQIKQSIRDYVLGRDTSIKVADGSIPGDVFLSAEAQIFQDEEFRLDYVRQLQSLDGVLEIIDDETYLTRLRDVWAMETIEEVLLRIRTDLEMLVHNYNITPTPSTYGTGVARFYRVSAPTSDLTITVGTQVYADIDGTKIYFEVTEQVTMYFSQSDGYQTYDSTLDQVIWRIDAPIRAVEPGASGNVGVGTIINGTIPSGFNGVKNDVATTGGSDEESDASLINRARLSFEGREMATLAGLSQFFTNQPEAVDALVVDVDDDLMVRDGGYGGMVDVYIMGTDITQTTDPAYTGQQITILDSGDAEIVMTNQPAKSVSLVENVTTGQPITTASYSFVEDTGDYKGSVRGQNKIVIDASAGITQADSIRITYTYDRLMNQFQDLIEDPNNKVLDADILVKEADAILLDIGFKLTIASTYDKLVVKNNVITNIQNFLSGLVLNQSVYQSDLVNIIENTDGVDHVDIPFTILARRGSTGASDIIITKNEYPTYDGDSFNLVDYY